MTDAELRITRARATMLNREPFYGLLATRLELVEAPEKVPTMATDGRRLLYNPAFVLSLSASELDFAIRHETDHVAFEHSLRREGRDPVGWNMAADYSVNGRLRAEGYGLLAGCLDDRRFDGWAAERIYPEVVKPGEKPKRVSSQTSGGKGSLKAPGEDDVLDYSPAPGEADSSGKPLPSPSELRSAIRQAVQTAANAARSLGQLPGSLQRALDAAEASRRDYKSILRQWLLQVARSDYSWSRPSRRGLALGYYAPSLRAEGSGLIVYAVDVSGSMDTRILRSSWSEARGAHEQIKGEAFVFYADTRICGELHVQEGDELPALANFGGGGGTSFVPVFKEVEKRSIQPAALIYFTDLEGVFPKSDPGYPVLWVTDRIPRAPLPSFGTVLPFLGA
jgi:predicted metal-dependent peptidase